jgi:hypothetical protein
MDSFLEEIKRYAAAPSREGWSIDSVCGHREQQTREEKFGKVAKSTPLPSAPFPIRKADTS